MHFVAKLGRLIHIKYIFLKYDLDKFIWSNPHFHSIHWLIIFFPWRWFGQQPKPNGEAIRLALSDLGPIFVKFGQLLSTRRDLLPDDVANELAKLQDCVPPFSGELAKKMIEKSLQQPLTAVFSDFNLVPLASASISQVHSATLLTGERVVVKVLRPNIHQQVIQDIELMETMALFFEKFVKTSRRLRPIEVVAEIKQTLIDELDLLREAANASQLRRNFINADTLHVPQIYWQQSRKDVLVIERVHGIPISNIQKLKENNTNLKVLAERGVEIFFTQVFRDCFFHADMHPGNIFVSIDSPENPKYVAVDFGIMGTLGPDDQRYLGENFLAFFKRDYRKVAELHVQSGWVPPNTPIHAFEAAIRTVCEPIFEKPLKEISFAQTLIRLFQTAQRFDMQIQPQLLLLQKTLLSIEGLGRQLYPDLDLWQTAKPFLEKWMKKHYGPQAFFSELWNRLPQWTDKLPEIPEAIYDIARFYQDETHRLKYQQTPASAVIVKDQLLKLSHKHIGRKIIGTALLVCATIIGLDSPYANIIQEYSSWLIGAGLGVGIILLLI